jgi:hypothetical protein
MRAALILLGAAAIALVLFLVFRPDGDDDEAATTRETTTEQATTTAEQETTTEAATTTEPAETGPTRIRVTVRNGRPVGGVQRATLNQGDRVVLVVRSDVADHVHVHGFDLLADVDSGQPARFDFRADLTGRFEVELEDRRVPIAELRVNP